MSLVHIHKKNMPEFVIVVWGGTEEKGERKRKKLKISSFFNSAKSIKFYEC